MILLAEYWGGAARTTSNNNSRIRASHSENKGGGVASPQASTARIYQILARHGTGHPWHCLLDHICLFELGQNNTDIAQVTHIRLDEAIRLTIISKSYSNINCIFSYELACQEAEPGSL